jgi:hypothetical protein
MMAWRFDAELSGAALPPPMLESAIVRWVSATMDVLGAVRLIVANALARSSSIAVPAVASLFIFRFC